MTIITKKSLVAAGVLSALMTINAAVAADVPAGVQLADKQTLVRNNGSEVQRLFVRQLYPCRYICRNGGVDGH